MYDFPVRSRSLEPQTLRTSRHPATALSLTVLTICAVWACWAIKSATGADAAMLQGLNGFAHRWWTLDYAVVWLTNDGFQKGGILMLLLWWVWFKPGDSGRSTREILICVAAAAPVALVVSRLISFAAPFQARPLYNPDLDVRLAYTLSPEVLIHWNSFPSDHAALFFTFVIGFFLISWRFGLLALVHVLVVVCFPRVFLGIHYPTDILAGAVLGAGIGAMACLPTMRSVLARPALAWMDRHPGPFYLCLFFYTYQMSNALGWMRDIVVLVLHLARHQAS
jgi:undecaprenyl-diphosphatase